MQTKKFTIKNNVSVIAPDAIGLMTPFVLQEQNDWFEDEIKFMRFFIKPGMKIIDIGANYGLYTLTIAKLIGESGKLWAFEPTSATADCLKQSIKENNFTNIKLIQAGLSNKTGKAKIFLSPNSELNSLTNDAGTEASSETINLLTLDSCLNDFKWKSIDFLKLDAEGEESNILKKGKNTLASLSPLIMFELKHCNTINISLISKFQQLGYDTYRLVPGLNVLIPFSSSDDVDGFLLNLFCCKQGKAEELEKEGIIVQQLEEKNGGDFTVTKNYIKGLGFGTSISQYLEDCKDEDYMDILNLYVLSKSEEKNSKEKVSYLFSALNKINKMLEKDEKKIERLSTFSRVAFDAGDRTLGINIIQKVFRTYGEGMSFELDEPFFPACERYDEVSPEGKIKEWLYSSLLEQFINKHAFSCYFSGEKSLPHFGMLASLGFMDNEFKNRQKLLTTALA